ncbi:MAG: FtsQ-type POTRA domain-containing protein [Desulfobacula sp.]|uniref:cell division protein FtsQ/DivIB n=1 Tax=Desulfobacula sp. TaxID=2593537 RepID=UPI0025C63CD6|nr:FtsQ-type POTRA domain-containing protein [Desulfobacula sp.]MCD4718258.1 FtsQ-type POTRA domain-containing protein [Desulfobacula sp.]
MSKKIKPNRYKSEANECEVLNSNSGVGIDSCLKCIMVVAFISILSLASIFVYDFITQSDFFNIKKIKISGTTRVIKKDILQLANLTCDRNIFGLNLFTIEKLIASHPWIQSACVKRNLSSVLSISIIEQKPLAIVKIENLADILINTQGRPFKEYNPLKDHLENLPVITGLDLTSSNNRYMFNGTLFNSIMDFLKIDGLSNIKQIKGDQNTGIAVETNDIYNQLPSGEQGIIQIKLGFNNFKAKLKKAKK